MKITKTQLRQIIKEEVQKVINEGDPAEAMARIQAMVKNGDYREDWAKEALEKAGGDPWKALDIISDKRKKDREAQDAYGGQWGVAPGSPVKYN